MSFLACPDLRCGISKGWDLPGLRPGWRYSIVGKRVCWSCAGWWMLVVVVICRLVALVVRFDSSFSVGIYKYGCILWNQPELVFSVGVYLILLTLTTCPFLTGPTSHLPRSLDLSLWRRLHIYLRVHTRDNYLWQVLLSWRCSLFEKSA